MLRYLLIALLRDTQRDTEALWGEKKGWIRQKETEQGGIFFNACFFLLHSEKQGSYLRAALIMGSFLLVVSGGKAKRTLNTVTGWQTKTNTLSVNFSAVTNLV